MNPAAQDSERTPASHGERVVKLESRLDVLSADVTRLAASHERTDQALRGIADKISESFIKANEALRSQSDAFIVRIDQMGSTFTTKINEMMVSERDQDKTVSAKIDGLDHKYATKDDVGTIKNIILAVAGAIAAYAFHKFTGVGS